MNIATRLLAILLVTTFYASPGGAAPPDYRNGGSIHVAAIQLQPIDGDIAASQVKISELVRQAAARGAKYILLPEYYPGQLPIELWRERRRGPPPLFALAPYGTVLIRSPRPTVAATVPLAQTELHETASGLRVHIPIGSNQCWDSPLPCTPYFRRNLSQRKGGDLGSGFYLSAAATCADIHSCEPPGFTTPPTIGVAVVFEDWYPFEEATKLVWMKATGRFLLYVEKPVNVTLSLVPAVIHEQGDFGQQGRLAIRLDGRLLGRFDIAAEQKLEVPLSLRADFNQVTLELEAGSFVPSEHIPDYPDMREFGIAFHEFVLTEERDSGTLPTP